jgi:hypothetical protein
MLVIDKSQIEISNRSLLKFSQSFHHFDYRDRYITWTPEIEGVSADFHELWKKIKKGGIDLRSSTRFVHGDIRRRGRCLVGYPEIGFEIEGNEQSSKSRLS